jgi:hypothetical protein
MEALLDGESEALTRKAVELAKGGDMQALRLCLDRILPPRKDRPLTFTLPAITGTTDAARRCRRSWPPCHQATSHLARQPKSPS